MVWYGMVWYGMFIVCLWYGIMEYSVMWCCVVVYANDVLALYVQVGYSYGTVCSNV